VKTLKMYQYLLYFAAMVAAGGFVEMLELLLSGVIEVTMPAIKILERT